MIGSSFLVPSLPSSKSAQAPTFTFSSTSVVSVVTATPGRPVSCIFPSGEETIGETGGDGGIINQECQSEALGAFAVLATQTKTFTARAAPLVTSPPAFPQFAALLVEATTARSINMSSTSTTSEVTPTSTSGGNSLGPESSTATSNSSSERAKMTYTLIIAGITLATVVLLFWIWTRYRRNRQATPGSLPLPSPRAESPLLRCMHTGADCECSRLRKMYDGVVTEFNVLRLGSLSLRSSSSNADPSEVEKGLANQGARPGTSGSRTGLPASDLSEIPVSSRDNDERRRRYEDEYRRRRASRASQMSQRSQRNVLAELEGDLGPYSQECNDVVPPMPTFLSSNSVRGGEVDESGMYETIMRTRNKTFVVRRKTMIGEGKSGVVVKGKLAATIVAVRRKPVPGASKVVTKGTIEGGGELDFPAVMGRHMLVYGGKDEDENEVAHIRTSRMNDGEGNSNDEDEGSVQPKEQAGYGEVTISNAMRQTKLSDLRKERRRRKREELAKGGGSRDLSLDASVHLKTASQ